jgi:flagellar basal-body rod modification protein FlgD
MSSTDPLTGLGGVGMNTPQTSPGSNSQMGQMDFLQLLMVQLSYQDPMNPVDSQQFSAQLAQFSQLEQLTQMNENLSLSQQTNLLLAQSVNNTMAAGMIGQTIVANGNQVQVTEGEETSLNYHLNGAAQTTTITIKNSAGATVRTIEAGPQSSGDQTTTWDGLDDAGNAVPEGIYTFSVNAATSQGVTVQTTTYTQGVITGVSYLQGMATFMIGDLEVGLGDIIRVEG